MIVSWTAPGSLPNSYTVTAQPGGLTATVSGSTTSATLNTTLSGVAYNVSVVATYSGSTQTATITLVSPPAALPVPMTTDIAPWLWYDAADPTTIRVNSSGNLTEWYNKGTSAGSTNGNITFNSAVINTGQNIGNRQALKFVSGNILTPTISIPVKPYALFIILDIDPATFTNGTTIYPPSGDLSLAVINNGTKATILGTFPNVRTTLTYETTISNVVGKRMFSMVNSSTAANNVAALNGQTQTLIHSESANFGTTGNTQYYIGPYISDTYKGCTVGEVLIIRNEITATQRMQIEGYLAWKWGLQAQLPATHPFSAANMSATMSLYNRPRLYVSTLASVSAPRGVVVDLSGNIFYGTTGGLYKFTAGTPNLFYSTPSKLIIDIAIDASNNLYVANYTDNTVVRLTQSGTPTTIISSISQPHCLAIDSVNKLLYVNSIGSQTVNRYNLDGSNVATFASITGTLSNMKVDANGDVYGLYAEQHSLVKFTKATGVLTTIAGSGSAGWVDGFGTAVSFNTPRSLAIAPNGNMYIGDNTSIRLATPAGLVQTISGTGTQGTISTGLDSTARYAIVMSIAISPITGELYISDFNNPSIRKLSLGTLNQTAIYASESSTYQTTGDAFGNLFMTSYAGRIVRRITPTGSISTFVGSGAESSTNGVGINASFISANGIVQDELGNMYVAEHASGRIRKVSPAGLVTTLTTSVTSPLGLTMGPDSNIYASCHGDHTIYQITRAGVVSLYAGASGQLGSTDNVSRLSARFNVPCSVAFYNGAMYVADGANNKIRKIDASGIVTTFAGSGSATESDGTGIGAGVASPHGVTADNNGNLYITGWNATRVRKITQSAVVSTIVSGIANQTYSFIDSAQNLWVSEAATGLRHVAINAIPTGSVSITGTLTQGQTIMANVSTLADSDGLGTFSYAWFSSATAGGVYTAITGATSATLTLAEAQVGRFIRVIVSYTDGRGSAEAVSSAAVGSIVNVNDTAVGLDISGSFIRGQTLTARTANIIDPDGNSPPYTYQWSASTLAASGFVDISGATSSTYVLTTADIGRYIRLTVSYSNNYGSADSAIATSATAVITDNTAVSGTLDISGTLREDAVVRAIPNLVDPDGFGPLTYTWSSSEASDGVFRTDASGVDLSGITLSYSQATRFLRVEVRYVDLKGKAENMISSVVGPIIAHTTPSAPTIGDISAGITSVALTWITPTNNGGRPITGYEIRDENGNLVKSVDASANSTTITDLLPGVSRRFTVIALNERGSSAASSQSSAATPTNPPASALLTGAISEVINVPISISGVATVAKKLTPTVAANGKKTVSYNPEPGTKTAVDISGLPANVDKVVVATAAPQSGYTTLKIAAFDSANQSVSNFASAPITITVNVPGYTAATLLVRTFDQVGGPIRDTLTATRNGDGSYSMTLSHLTYLRISENVPCFVAGTKILTAAGYKAVEDIVDGELVATADGRALRCKVYITEIDETTKENAPITIPANTFAPRCPASDLTLSPLHAIQIRQGVWQLPKMATSMYTGVRQASLGETCTYYHLEMPNYLTDNIVAEGTVVESYGARQLVGRCVEYKFSGAIGGFVRIVKDKKRTVAASH